MPEERPALLACEDVRVRLGSGRHAFDAVDGVTVAVAPAATLGVVGESGAGKSTLARALAGLVPVAAGRVTLDGEDVTNPRGRQLRKLRETVQMVFQDPYSSLNPRMTAGETLREAVRVHRRELRGAELARELARLLELTALPAALAGRYPHELSGGQRQRVAIARALAASPSVLIADEITSALDVSMQAHILNLLRTLAQELQLSMVFVSHNLAVVRYISDDVAVMYRGKVVERASTAELFADPRHEYTRVLLDAIPQPDRPLRGGPAGHFA